MHLTSCTTILLPKCTTQSRACALRQTTQLNFHSQQAKFSNLAKVGKVLTRTRNVNVFLCFVHFCVKELLLLFFSTVPHWCKQPSVCAGWWPAAVCESRPSQGQTEPLCYPLLPCVPPGFFPPFSSLSFFFFSTQLRLFKPVLFCLLLLLLLVLRLLGETKTG